MLPITALGIVVRVPLVEVLFGYGLFDGSAVALTADTLCFFLLGLAAHSLIAVLARAFYAGRDTRTPVAAAILAVVVNVTLGIALVGPMGLGGLALAIAFGAWAEALVLLEILRRRYPAFDIPRRRPGIRWRRPARRSLAGIAAFAVLWALDGDRRRRRPGKLGSTSSSWWCRRPSAASSTSAAAVALRIPELPTIVAVMSDLLRRPSRIRGG